MAQWGPIDSRERQVIRWLVWTYFLFVILEGPLRKWIIPGMSNELLLIRDPIAVLLYTCCVFQGLVRTNWMTICFGLIGVCAGVLGMVAGTGNLIVTMYGFDASFFHLPIIFIIARVFNRTDVIKMGQCILFLSIPMAVLMVIQFRSSPHALVNVGPGGIAGTQMQGVLGKIRPPGYFNFITGAAQFLACTAAFLVHGLLQKAALNKMFLSLCGVALIISATVSTSRLALGGIGVVFLMIGVIGLYNRDIARGVVGMLLPVGFAFFVATNLDIFNEGRYVFEARLENTGDAGGGIAKTASNWSERILGDFMAGVKAIKNAPLFGYGLGYGTNVGARILSGKLGFFTDEREWGRVVFEMGPLLAVPYLLGRVGICAMLFRKASQSARIGNFLPMLLLGAFGLPIVNAQFAIASTVGFTVLGCGLCIAANKSSERSEDDAAGVRIATMTKAQSTPRRSRSVYAKGLFK